MKNIIAILTLLISVNFSAIAVVPSISNSIICYLQNKDQGNLSEPTKPQRSTIERPCCEIDAESGEMTILASGEIESVTLTDSYGAVIYQSLDGSGTYDIGTLVSGIYTIEVEIDQVTYSADFQL